MGGLSKDPEKRARQLAGLGKANTIVSERVAAGHDYAPPEAAPAAARDPLPAPHSAPAAAQPVTPPARNELPSSTPQSGGTIAGIPIAQRQEAPRREPDPKPEPDAGRGADEREPVVEPEPRGGFLRSLATGR